VAAKEPSRGAATRRPRLRDLRVRTKLVVISGTGIVAVLVVALVGVVGLGRVNGRAHDLAHIGKILRDVAELRDNEGDMRVNVQVLASAHGAAEVKAALADVKDSDGVIDGTAAGLRAEITATRDKKLITDFAGFLDGLQAWRQIRDAQLVPAVQAGDNALAHRVLVGPMTKADDAFAAPLDAASGRISGEVTPDAKAASSTYSQSRLLIIAILLAAVLLVGLLSLAISRLITGPLARVSGVLKGLADGDLTGAARVDSRDELGDMAGALDTALASLRTAIGGLGDSAGALTSAAAELSDHNDQIAASAHETSANAESASAAAAAINANVGSVATGAAQMTAAIDEIARNATDAAGVTNQAVRSAGDASAAMAKLDESSSEINAVIKMINGIADQTSLLALNATIEAARAGEAGKGFAVVASEVKELAQETARATEDVARRVHAIRSDASAAAEAITAITAVIEQVNQYTTTIAAAVEEQTASTGAMSDSIGAAAVSSQRIAETMAGVSAAAITTSNGSAGNRMATSELARMAAELNQLVATFRY